MCKDWLYLLSLWRCLLKTDMTEELHFHFSLSCVGEGNGNPLQYSCLENPRDGGAWWVAIYGSHRVGNDWSNLAAAAAASKDKGSFLILREVQQVQPHTPLDSLPNQKNQEEDVGGLVILSMIGNLVQNDWPIVNRWSAVFLGILLAYKLFSLTILSAKWWYKM